jgi:hypothetical protein
MRPLSATALFCLLLFPASTWAQDQNQNKQDDAAPRLSAVNMAGMADSSSLAASSSPDGDATAEARAISAGSSSSMQASPMMEASPLLGPGRVMPAVAMVEPVAPAPQPGEKEKINPWTAPFTSRRFIAANSLLLFSWTADIEGTHFCLVRRTCIEGNHAIMGYPHPTRAQLYASTPWELPAVMASSYLSHVVLPRKWKWLSYLPPVLIGGMHAYFGEQGFKRGLFDARIRPPLTSSNR